MSCERDWVRYQGKVIAFNPVVVGLSRIIKSDEKPAEWAAALIAV